MRFRSLLESYRRKALGQGTLRPTIQVSHAMSDARNQNKAEPSRWAGTAGSAFSSFDSWKRNKGPTATLVAPRAKMPDSSSKAEVGALPKSTDKPKPDALVFGGVTE